ncbi:hypothetical protein B0J11DRAFT_531870 [Dendryphion nanum]|uniref:Uncharacterized protein n=1 Tax=Dendryphion nanum TaxID=256645 RepID=A0A9P9IKI4_9PLEO|nr:hypothetical protein B0J11DRAFT_531870 [Dendryphion nanum]
MELETAKNGQAQGDTITNAPGNSTTVNNHTDSTSPDRPLTPDSNEANNRSSFRHMARIHRELGYDVPENVFPGEGSVDEYKCLYSPTFHAFGRLYPGLKQVASHHKEIKFAVPAIQPLTAAQIRREMRQEVQTQLNPKTTGTCANDDASTEQLPISIATLHISENDKKMDEMARVLKRPDSALSPPSRGEHTGLIEDNPNDYEICPGVHVGIPACMLPKFGQIAQAEQEVQVLFQGLDGERDVPEIPPWENSDSPQVPELQHKSHI